MKKYVLPILLFALSAKAQDGARPSLPSSVPKSDSVIIFEPTIPLISYGSDLSSDRPHSWGFGGSISDFGFGLGLYYRYGFSRELAATARFDIGGAKGSKEYGFEGEIKVHRIFVMPLTVSFEQRLFSETLSENFRPYIGAGGGAAFIMTNDGQREYFSALIHPSFHTAPVITAGIGSYFGSDPSSTFSVHIRYNYIPFPHGIESTKDRFLTDFSAIVLGISYGFNW